MRHLHLTHPRLDFWVAVEIHEGDGRYMATADLGEDSRDVGVDDAPQEAVRAALRSLGEPYASETVEGSHRTSDARGTCGDGITRPVGAKMECERPDRPT